MFPFENRNPPYTHIVLGFGSNIGNRERYINKAIMQCYDKVFRKHHQPTSSPWYRTDAVLTPDAPPEWNIPFLNLALCGETLLSPRELLNTIKEIEQSVGRKDRGKWAPREIDIDILVYGNQYINESDLIIPHPHILERDFVLIPLVDVAPKWRYPVPGPYFNQPIVSLKVMLYPKHTLLRYTRAENDWA